MLNLYFAALEDKTLVAQLADFETKIALCRSKRLLGFSRLALENADRLVVKP